MTSSVQQCPWPGRLKPGRDAADATGGTRPKHRNQSAITRVAAGRLLRLRQHLAEVAGGQSRRLSVSDASHCAARLGAVEARRRVEAGRYGMRAALGKDAARVARGQFRTSGFVFGCQPIAARIGPRDRRDQQLGVRVLRRRDDALDRARFRQMGAI